MVRKLEPGEVPPKYMTRRDRINAFDDFMVHNHKPGHPEMVDKYRAWEAKWEVGKEEFMESCTVTNDPESCWEWKGPFRDDGQPILMIRDYASLARRMAWFIFRFGRYSGRVPQNYWVVQGCGSASCVRPEHSKLEYHKRGGDQVDEPKFTFNT